MSEPVLQPIAMNHVSVDCVVFGFDGDNMKCLLIKRTGEENGEVFHDMKLPGSLIYRDEDLDQAARRVLSELTGLKNVHLNQFKAYGSKDRTRDPKDVHWLERAQKEKVERIVTVAYIALIKIDRAHETLNGNDVCWIDCDKVPTLAFDHNIIIRDAVAYMRLLMEMDPSLMFNLLPRKFTAAQLRRIFAIVAGKDMDPRNFHKKLSMMPYVVPLDEKEKNVAHRAARFFRFDRTIYKKTRI
ncbi:MAG: NUDIX hydrolase [Bacteroidales bacterium]|nr:NUDIX hydrolase [Bacteroidales bacterium]